MLPRSHEQQQHQLPPLPFPSATSAHSIAREHQHQHHSQPSHPHPHPDHHHQQRHQTAPEQPMSVPGEGVRSEMYPPYTMSHASQQYQQHPLSQPSYQPTQNRMLPPGPSSGMLPPAHALTQSMSSYAAPTLPGPLPLPFDAGQQTPAATPSTSTVFSEPNVYKGTKGSYKYELKVEQQPQRARMCGFGDKDRRPITPPPCVRLIIRRADTDEEVDFEDIDGSFFVLQVDLWDADGMREVNVIRASSSAPTQSISTAIPMSYPPPMDRGFSGYMDMSYPGGNSGFAMPPGYMYPHYVPQSSSAVMYTRNLIGSLTVNASALKDPDGNSGYWFVLSDLSVRTEGWFRLRMSFIDVGNPNGEPGLNRARCPVLASTFSDKFQVYSAKKFPGVIESTPLSKCFAQQGIKIPIRKDGKGGKDDDDD